MKKENIIIIGLAVAILAIGGLYFRSGETQKNFGNLNVNENAYSSGITYATTSISTNIATSLLVRATSSRTYAKICNLSANYVYLYKQSTSTGVLTGMGEPLSATSSNGISCATYNSIDPYTGQIFGITGATSTVSIESLQN